MSTGFARPPRADSLHPWLQPYTPLGLVVPTDKRNFMILAPSRGRSSPARENVGNDKASRVGCPFGLTRATRHRTVPESADTQHPQDLQKRCSSAHVSRIAGKIGVGVRCGIFGRVVMAGADVAGAGNDPVADGSEQFLPEAFGES